jgi:hypothetical protein
VASFEPRVLPYVNITYRHTSSNSEVQQSMQVDMWYFLITSKHQCTAQTVIRNIWLWRLIMRGQWIMNEDTTHVKPAMSLIAIQVYNKWIWWQTGKIHWVHYNKTQASRHLKQPSIITESAREQRTLQSTQVLYHHFFSNFAETSTRNRLHITLQATFSIPGHINKMAETS